MDKTESQNRAEIYLIDKIKKKQMDLITVKKKKILISIRQKTVFNISLIVG